MDRVSRFSLWARDYFYLARGGVAMLWHRDPPAHYLDYVIPGKVPVILIPGIMGKWSFMKELGDRISLNGHPVLVVPDLKYNLFSIPYAAEILRGAMDAFPKLHVKGAVPAAAQRIAIVGHSKGGLIGKYLMVHYNVDNMVCGMVAIATPFSGSRLARMVPHRAFRELAPEHTLIRDLENHREVNKKIISIIPEYDNHIWAPQGSFLEGAENIRVPVEGHHKVLFSPEVGHEVLRALERFV